MGRQYSLRSQRGLKPFSLYSNKRTSLFQWATSRSRKHRATSSIHMSLTPISDAVTESFIRSGPIFNACQGIKFDMLEWQQLGRVLEMALNQQGPAEANPERIFHYYLPVFFWVEGLKSRTMYKNKTLIVGLSCPQGGGKTTITEFLEMLFKARGMKCVVASIDDFYLTRAEQQQVANTNKGNRLLELRGNPGTHDIPLAIKTCTELRQGKLGHDVLVPRYNKAAFHGLGDRADPSEWSRVSTPVDIVILEGWCLGFEKIESESELSQHPSDLRAVNHNMDEFSKLYDLLDALMVIKISDVNWVFEWRAQAERSMIARGKTGMSEEQIRDFVSRFMPSYKAYLPSLYKKFKDLADHVLVWEIDESRKPVAAMESDKAKAKL